MYPPFRPHKKHRLTRRVEYLGFLFDLAIVDFLAMIVRKLTVYFLIGNSIIFNNSSPCSLFFAVVTTVI